MIRVCLLAAVRTPLLTSALLSILIAPEKTKNHSPSLQVVTEVVVRTQRLLPFLDLQDEMDMINSCFLGFSEFLVEQDEDALFYLLSGQISSRQDTKHLPTKVMMSPMYSCAKVSHLTDCFDIFSPTTFALNAQTSNPLDLP